MSTAGRARFGSAWRVSLWQCWVRHGTAGHGRAGTYLGVLSIDEVLFDYEGPRIFTARSTSNRLFYAYIVDEDEDEATETYVYLPLSDVRWAQIRSGRLGLRAAVERPEDGFVFIVTADYGAGRSAVREASPADLDPRWLPTEAAVLNLATPTRPDFSTQELGRIAVQEHRVQVAVELEPSQQRTEVSLKTLGRMSLAMQDVIDAVAQEEEGAPTPRGAIGQDILKRVDLSFTTSMAASFVMVMAPTRDEGLFSDPLLDRSLERLTALLASSGDSAEAFRAQLRPYGPRVVSKLRAVFETAYGDESGHGGSRFGGSWPGTAGQAGQGIAGLVPAWFGWARYGAAGGVRLGWVSHGTAEQVTAGGAL